MSSLPGLKFFSTEGLKVSKYVLSPSSYFWPSKAISFSNSVFSYVPHLITLLYSFKIIFVFLRSIFAFFIVSVCLRSAKMRYFYALDIYGSFGSRFFTVMRLYLSNFEALVGERLKRDGLLVDLSLSNVLSLLMILTTGFYKLSFWLFPYGPLRVPLRLCSSTFIELNLVNSMTSGRGSLIGLCLTVLFAVLKVFDLAGENFMSLL